MSAAPVATPVPISQKTLALANKIQKGKIEFEVGYPQILVLIILGLFYTAITALGIDKFNKCEAIQDSQKFKNLKMFMSHTMAIAIAIPVAFLISKIVQREGSAFTIVYAILGLTSSAMAMNIMNQEECKDQVKKSDKDFAIASIVGWVLLLLVGSFLFFKSKKRLANNVGVNKTP